MENTNELLHLLHTPEELIATSNLAHNIEGVIFLLLSLSYFSKKDVVRRFFRPGLLCFSGLFLILFVLFHHPPSEWGLSLKVTLSDRQQFQHFLITMVTIFGGVFEYLGQKKKNILTISIPTVLLLIGIIFMMHPQHGTSEAATGAVFFHEILGAMFIGSGFLQLGYKAFNYKLLNYLSIILMIAVSLLLIFYKEPAGAYHALNLLS